MLLIPVFDEGAGEDYVDDAGDDELSARSSRRSTMSTGRRSVTSEDARANQRIMTVVVSSDIEKSTGSQERTNLDGGEEQEGTEVKVRAILTFTAFTAHMHKHMEYEYYSLHCCYLSYIIYIL